MDLRDKLRHVMDFPVKGIDFIDITPVLQDSAALRQCIDEMNRACKAFGEFDLIVGPESRGFLLGVPLAVSQNKGFVPVRKPGKLPYDKIRVEYELEYGKSVLEMHRDAIQPGQRVVIVDDLLATGGTINSIISLVQQLGGEVAGIIVMIELTALMGRELLHNCKVESIVAL